MLNLGCCNIQKQKKHKLSAHIGDVEQFHDVVPSVSFHPEV